MTQEEINTLLNAKNGISNLIEMMLRNKELAKKYEVKFKYDNT